MSANFSVTGGAKKTTKQKKQKNEKTNKKNCLEIKTKQKPTKVSFLECPWLA